MPASPDLLAVLAGDVAEVAPRLLGAVVRHGDVAVRLTEVEAYGAADDPGSHAHRGRTARNASMFGPAGRLYCYFTYGMHVCANVVTGPEGQASAVLLRAGEVVAGLDEARLRRPRSSDRDLARGPARLCNALGITLDHDGYDVLAGPVTLELAAEPPGPPGPPGPSGALRIGPRVGLRGAPEWPWRFWIEGDRTVSVYRPATPARPREVPGFGLPDTRV